MSKQSEHLFDAITQADDRMVENARVNKKRPRWRAITALAACLALIIGIAVWQPWHGGGFAGEATGTAPIALAQPVYPVMAAYPDESSFIKADGEYDSDASLEAFMAWSESVEKQTRQPEGYTDGLENYFGQSVRQFLSGDENSNRAFSPVNVYMALAMLAESTVGESRAQILDLLGADSIEALRAQASSVWNANYRDDGMTKSLLASSHWLREGENYNQATMDSIAQNYYASVFSGKMGSDAYDQMLQDWLNEQTGDLLSEQAAGEGFDPDTVIGLATTVAFHTKWTDPFLPEATEPGVFHAAAGDETADFMHREEAMRGYYRGEHFGAIPEYLESGGTMWLILPDEGVTPEALLQDDDAIRFISGDISDWNSQLAIVNLSVPKFDVASQCSLIEGLQAMGVTDVCDPATADFSPVRENADGMYLTSANHAVRVAIDEEGVSAVAYTVMGGGLGAPDPELWIDFNLDRPFLYVITGQQGVPLFTGIVNTVG